MTLYGMSLKRPVYQGRPVMAYGDRLFRSMRYSKGGRLTAADRARRDLKPQSRSRKECLNWRWRGSFE
ncbi:uncharacterized protein RhaS with RHS repeats [Streptosporangium saharense]|uniref:Uncharacterized protein RhaS with RHS repeats n=1 Tax=Streptosporangium saharense TaxID=1706840 RepID=A0A7W7QH86_9ACTN|nr:uncharacterized protein RhaS with RHS repeats [Streptosporangium saharense]